MYLKGEREQTQLPDDQLPRKDIARHIELVLIGPGLTFTLVHKLDCMRERFSIDVNKLIFMLDLIRPKRVEHLRRNAKAYQQIYEAEYKKIVERAFAVYDTNEDILMAQQRINDDQTHARANPLSKNDPNATAGITPGVEFALMHGNDTDTNINVRTLECLSDRLR